MIFKKSTVQLSYAFGVKLLNSPFSGEGFELGVAWVESPNSWVMPQPKFHFMLQICPFQFPMISSIFLRKETPVLEEHLFDTHRHAEKKVDLLDRGTPSAQECRASVLRGAPGWRMKMNSPGESSCLKMSLGPSLRGEIWRNFSWTCEFQSFTSFKNQVCFVAKWWVVKRLSNRWDLIPGQSSHFFCTQVMHWKWFPSHVFHGSCTFCASVTGVFDWLDWLIREDGVTIVIC